MDAGHYIPKGTGAKGKALEFCEENVHAQCPQCNRNKGYNVATVEMIKVRYSNFMIQHYGKNIFDRLFSLQKIIKKPDYLEIYNTYKNKLKEI